MRVEQASQLPNDRVDRFDTFRVSARRAPVRAGSRETRQGAAGVTGSAESIAVEIVIELEEREIGERTIEEVGFDREVERLTRRTPIGADVNDHMPSMRPRVFTGPTDPFRGIAAGRRVDESNTLRRIARSMCSRCRGPVDGW
jgi:hypothetical protein